MAGTLFAEEEQTLSLETIAMPVLPSGRRIEYSLDRFHALLASLDGTRAQQIAATMEDPDDLLFVLDAVHFSRNDGAPYFAGYVAADASTHAADWSSDDRQALQSWLFSTEARAKRAEAIGYVKSLMTGRFDVAYPYALVREQDNCSLQRAPLRRQ